MAKAPTIRIPHPHVRSLPGLFSGSPHVAGSTVLVWELWRLHRNGWNAVAIAAEFRGQVSLSQVFDALSFAIDNQDVMEEEARRAEARMWGGAS